MIATVLAVLVLGVIIATIAHAVLADEQPATAAPADHRDPAGAARQAMGSEDHVRRGPPDVAPEPAPADDGAALVPLGDEGTVLVPAGDLVPEGGPDEPPILVPADDLRVEGRPAVPVAAAEPAPLPVRVRSALSLAGLLVVVGAAAAAALGVAIAAGAGVLDQALG